MSKSLSAVTAKPKGGTLEDLIPRPMLFPDENPIVYEDLRDALIRDLAPGTPYERALAENLVTLEWEAIRHRRMRDNLIKVQARNLAIGVFSTGEIRDAYRPSEEDKRLGFALFSSDRTSASRAAAVLKKHGIGLEEIFAEAYSCVAARVERHETKLADIERRRRRLRDDYDRLKAARSRPVEDAEIVE